MIGEYYKRTVFVCDCEEDKMNSAHSEYPTGKGYYVGDPPICKVCQKPDYTIAGTCNCRDNHWFVLRLFIEQQIRMIDDGFPCEYSRFALTSMLDQMALIEGSGIEIKEEIPLGLNDKINMICDTLSTVQKNQEIVMDWVELGSTKGRNW